ncbi:hypothetical protein K439DRAFT_1165706 [Ramaria rubella]|nr:hypothetical protein K439DRAFT_1165706 [Ramaria rubella]
MSLPSFQELFSATIRVQAVKYATVAALVLQCQEWIICIPEEIEFVWQSHWGFGKFLYLASRYLAFIDTPMRIAYYLTPNPDIKFCSTTNTISGWFTNVGILISALVLMLRTIAIWDRSRKITVSLCLAAVVLQPFIASCNLIYASPIAFGDVLSLLLWELLIVCLTFGKAFQYYRCQNPPNRLLTTLYRDGIFFFVFMTGVSLADVLVLATAPPDAGDLLLSLIRVLHSIFTCRIMLHLKRASLPTFSGHETPTYLQWRVSTWPLPARPGDSNLSLDDEVPPPPIP